MTHNRIVLAQVRSVRKIIERVFGILKKRFRILKLPLCVKDLGDVEHVIRSCCILHNMIMEDKGH